MTTRNCLSNTPLTQQSVLQFSAMVPCTNEPRTLWRVNSWGNKRYTLLSFSDTTKALDGNIDIPPTNGYVIISCFLVMSLIFIKSLMSFSYISPFIHPTDVENPPNNHRWELESELLPLENRCCM